MRLFRVGDGSAFDALEIIVDAATLEYKLHCQYIRIFLHLDVNMFSDCANPIQIRTTSARRLDLLVEFLPAYS